uniref:Uncharacterized protein n=1 Tax=Vitis vinifera TaxID=29760 RepID=F6H8P6_VITVI
MFETVVVRWVAIISRSPVRYVETISVLVEHFL